MFIEHLSLLLYGNSDIMTATGINATASNTTGGWINGFIGVLIFSGSLPATRVAVLDFDPVFLTVARATIAGLLGLALLLFYKEKLPVRKQLFPLAIVAIGVVVGFPLLTALALQYVTSAHLIVFVGMLPLTTAIFGVIRGGERPRAAFWFFSLMGSFLVVGFAVFQGLSASPVGDILMLLAIILCGLGYAEGGKAFKGPGRMAGDLLGTGAFVARYGATGICAVPVAAGRNTPAGLGRIGLCVPFQYADRLCVLVPGTGTGRYCSGRTTAAAATIFRIGPCCRFVA